VELFQLSWSEMEDIMRRSITAVIAAATLAAAAVATPKPAEARCWGCWAGAGIAAGIIGGAIIASSAAYAYPGYGYAPYAYAPAYGYPPVAYGYAPAYYGGFYAPRRFVGPRIYRARAVGPRVAVRRAYVRRHR
jgi:hypothetical protein